MASPDCKRQKLADDVNSVAKMSKVSPTKNVETRTENRTSTTSTSKKLTVIDINVENFKEVAKFDGFVDRTMLIKELLQGEGSSFVMMFAPSKFGKTINVSMIRLFCDIEDKNTKTKEDVAKDPTMEGLRSNPSENMKVFLRQFGDKKYEECLILKEENFFIQHFGRHPVVSFNFKNCTAKNESQAIFFCAQQVKEGYEENEYLKNSKELQSEDVGLMKTCTHWLSYSDVELKSLCLVDVVRGLESLIKGLRIHWGRDPVFLVDEVDKPCVFALLSKLSEEQVSEIGAVITNVICSILKTARKNLMLQAALVTGICKFENSGLSPMDNTIPVYFLSDDRFSKYYGLTAEDVNSLVERFCDSQGDAEKTKIISDINAKYNGYYQRSSSGEKKEGARYCLFSVLNYLKNTNTKELCFWSDGGFLIGKLVPVLKKSLEIMNAIHMLVYYKSSDIQIEYQEKIDVQHIIGLYRDGTEPDFNETFNFFLQRGYLAHNLEKPKDIVDSDLMAYVRIPNLEIRNIYKRMFTIFRKNLPVSIKSELTSCGQIFKSLPMQDSTEFQNSLDRLCKHLKCIFEFMQCTNEATICSHILTILKYYAEYEKVETEYTVKYFDDNRKQCVVKIDVWGRRGNSGIIFEVKFNSGASREPGKIGCKTKSSLAAAEDIVKLLPGKEEPEGGSGGKAGTGRDLEVLKSQIENYVLIGLAVDADYTTHMLVFRDTSDWENVIQVNPEKHVAELISTHLKSEIPVV